MSIQDVAKDMVAMFKAGDFTTPGEKYWSEDVVSVEAGAPGDGDPTSRGKAAARAKGEWWSGAHDIHSVDVAGPFVNGDQFAVRFSMDITAKQSGQRMQMDEVGLYTVKDGKVVEERFFYAG